MDRVSIGLRREEKFRAGGEKVVGERDEPEDGDVAV